MVEDPNKEERKDYENLVSLRVGDIVIHSTMNSVTDLTAELKKLLKDKTVKSYLKSEKYKFGGGSMIG